MSTSDSQSKPQIHSYVLTPPPPQEDSPQGGSSPQGGKLRLVSGGKTHSKGHTSSSSSDHHQSTPMKQHGESSSNYHDELGKENENHKESPNEELCQGLNALKGHLDNHIKEHQGMAAHLSRLVNSSKHCAIKGGDTLYQVTGGEKGEPMGMDREHDDTIVCSRETDVFVRYRQNMRATLRQLLNTLGISHDSSIAKRLTNATRFPGEHWDNVRNQLVDMTLLVLGLPELNENHRLRCAQWASEGFDPCSKTRSYLLDTARSELERLDEITKLTADRLQSGLKKTCEQLLIPPYAHRILYNFCISCDVPAEQRMSTCVHTNLYNMVTEYPRLRETLHATYLMKNFLCHQYTGLHVQISYESKEKLKQQFKERVCSLLSSEETLSEEYAQEVIESLYSKLCKILASYNVKWSDIMRPETVRIGYPRDTLATPVSVSGGENTGDDEDDDDDDDNDDDDDDDDDDDSDSNNDDDDEDDDEGVGLEGGVTGNENGSVREKHNEIFGGGTTDNETPMGGDIYDGESFDTNTLYASNGESVRLPNRT